MHKTREASHRHICNAHARNAGTLILTENEDTIENIDLVGAVAGARLVGSDSVEGVSVHPIAARWACPVRHW